MDIKDILFCKEHGFEYIAQSFVCTQKDILDVKNALGENSQCRVIAKIENREGINNIDEIINVSDGIMIARGDMGVSLPIYEIPIIQKMIIKKCNRASKIVITATEQFQNAKHVFLRKQEYSVFRNFSGFPPARLLQNGKYIYLLIRS